MDKDLIGILEIAGLFYTAIMLFTLAFIIANEGSKRKIGYGWALFLGLFLSPIVSIVAVLFSEKIEPDADGDIEKNWGCLEPILAVSMIIILLILLFAYFKTKYEKPIEEVQTNSVIVN